MSNHLPLSLAPQQNEEYSLGSFVETYQTHVTRSGCIIFWGTTVFLLSLIGLIYSLIFSLASDLWLSSPSFFVLFLYVLPGLILTLQIGLFYWTLRDHNRLVTPIRRKIVISLYMGGFIYCEGRKRQIVNWEDILTVHKLAVKPWRTPRNSYKLILDDTTELILEIIITNIQELGAAVEQEIIKRLFPQMVADYETNRQIILPGLCINQHYISKSDEKLSWNEVEKITIDAKNLVIKEKETLKNWLVAPIAQFPNICVLETLLDHIRGEKRLPGNTDR